jgi:hypothetical protein
MMKKPRAPKAADDMKAGMPMPRFGARAMRPGGMAKGGKVHPDAAMDRKLIKEEIGKAHKKMGMKEGGAVKKMARGGGVETKGKTKGKFI